MDLDAERNKLQDELKWVEAYKEHPITVAILQDSKEEQEALVSLLCDTTIHNIETFFSHFEAIGHLRGLRRATALIEDRLDSVKQQLKALE